MSHLSCCVVFILFSSVHQTSSSYVISNSTSYISATADVISDNSNETSDNKTSSSFSYFHSNASLATLTWTDDVTTMDKNHSLTSHGETNVTEQLKLSTSGFLSATSSGVTSSCRLISINSSSYELVRYFIDQDHVKLIEYDIDLLDIDLTTSKSLADDTRCSWDVDHSVY